MKISLSLLLVLVAVAVSYAEPQIPFNYDYYNPYVRPSQDGVSSNSAEYNRFLLGTVTLTVSTTTSTSTVYTSTTCTTSTSALSVCIASARRRRGLAMGDDKKGRGLFYNEEEETDFASIFYPLEEPEKPVVPIEAEPARVARETLVPFVVQPGFNLPDGRTGRYLVAFGTSTITTVKTSTYTAFLTAKCRSTTNFKNCITEGKK